uniref:Uncharacterized protein n=1 Tax=Steinernema glaseri TaxID=37863 RepID=A0A1I8AV93_9BILA
MRSFGVIGSPRSFDDRPDRSALSTRSRAGVAPSQKHAVERRTRFRWAILSVRESAKCKVDRLPPSSGVLFSAHPCFATGRKGEEDVKYRLCSRFTLKDRSTKVCYGHCRVTNILILAVIDLSRIFLFLLGPVFVQNPALAVDSLGLQCAHE